MIKIYRYLLVSALSLLLTGMVFAAGDRFDRSAQIPPGALDPGGVGGIISGVDFDNDGKPEIYSVNNDWVDIPGEDWVPRIHKYEWNGSDWAEVWSTELDLTAQNTWPALTYGDWDNDGRMEVIWGPVNNFGGGNKQNPERVVVFEAAGDGSDDLGVFDPATGRYRPNAQWTIVDGDAVNMRPFRWFLHDIDSDGQQELVACTRAGDLPFLVISVDNIPDNADSSETWTLEADGAGSEIVGNTYYDIAVMDSSMYLIRSNGDVATVTYQAATDTFAITKTQLGLIPGGSWKSSSVVDIDGDGTQEIVVGGWASSADNKVWLLQRDADSLKATMIAEPGLVAGGRLYGGAAGDLSGDGLLDFAFGSRSTTPTDAIYRVAYQGGDITDPNNYVSSVIDSQVVSSSARFDVLAMGDLDGDSKDELAYTGLPEPVLPPITIVDMPPGDQPIISSVLDVPNDQGRQVRVSWLAAEDDVGGMRMTATLSGDNEVGPISTAGSGKATFVLNEDRTELSYLLQVFNIDSVSQAHIHQGGSDVNGPVGVFLFGPSTPAGPVNGVLASGSITAADLIGPWAGDWDGFLNDLLIGNTYVNVHTATHAAGEIRGQILTGPSSATVAKKTAGYTITEYSVWRKIESTLGKGSANGSGERMMIDGAMWEQVGTSKAVQLPEYGLVVPTLEDRVPDGGPAMSTFKVVAHTADPLTKWGSYAKSGFSEDNLVPQAPVNFMASEAETASEELYVALKWDATDDPDVDYYEAYRGSQPDFTPSEANLVGRTTELALDDLNAQPQIGETIYYKVRGVDFNKNIGQLASADVVITSVNDRRTVPLEYSLSQNYPNPFNPQTTIKYSLKEKGRAVLRVYSILGKEVATLVDENRPAGEYEVSFDASTMASGVYFYVLEVNGHRMQKRMTLMK